MELHVKVIFGYSKLSEVPSCSSLAHDQLPSKRTYVAHHACADLSKVAQIEIVLVIFVFHCSYCNGLGLLPELVVAKVIWYV
jgi:hypothetical protein